MSVKLLAMTNEPEKLIEYAGRTCYLSYDNIGATSADTFIRKAIERGHLSILEHAVATFKIDNVSRALLAQITRHRMSSFSVQSQRYCDMSKADCVVPPAIKENPEALTIFNESVNNSISTYKKLRELGITKEDSRFVLPEGICTEFVITANFRQWRWIFHERLPKNAQWEIRGVCENILSTLSEAAPNIFYDLKV